MAVDADKWPVSASLEMSYERWKFGDLERQRREREKIRGNWESAPLPGFTASADAQSMVN